MAVAAGADALGLVSAMPSGPGPIPDELIAQIAITVPPPVATFLLTSRTDPASIVDHVRCCHTHTVQLVDSVDPSTYALLRQHLPHVKIVQVLHVTGEDTVEQAGQIASLVDALLLDSGRPQGAVKELGGTGRVHDWSLSRRIVESSPVPVFLAGGLNASNVAEAVQRVRPFGVDLCSGVRCCGRLDPVKLEAFMSALL